MWKKFKLKGKVTHCRMVKFFCKAYLSKLSACQSQYVLFCQTVEKKPMFQCTFKNIIDLFLSFDEVNASILCTRRRKNCEHCANCMKPNCGKCINCEDMRAFGGQNVKKQRCVERACLNKR